VRVKRFPGIPSANGWQGIWKGYVSLTGVGSGQITMKLTVPIRGIYRIDGWTLKTDSPEEIQVNAFQDLVHPSAMRIGPRRVMVPAFSGDDIISEICNVMSWLEADGDLIEWAHADTLNEVSEAQAWGVFVEEHVLRRGAQ